MMRMMNVDDSRGQEHCRSLVLLVVVGVEMVAVRTFGGSCRVGREK